MKIGAIREFFHFHSINTRSYLQLQPKFLSSFHSEKFSYIQSKGRLPHALQVIASYLRGDLTPLRPLLLYQQTSLYCLPSINFMLLKTLTTSQSYNISIPHHQSSSHTSFSTAKLLALSPPLYFSFRVWWRPASTPPLQRNSSWPGHRQSPCCYIQGSSHSSSIGLLSRHFAFLSLETSSFLGSVTQCSLGFLPAPSLHAGLLSEGSKPFL